MAIDGIARLFAEQRSTIIVICCGSKKSSNLTFSWFTEVLAVVIATYEERPYAGGILLKGIILDWRCCHLVLGFIKF